MIPSRPSSPTNFKNTGIGVFTASAIGTGSLDVDFPGNSTAVPVRIRASGTVAGYVSLTVSGNKTITVLVNPNAPFTEILIPPGSYSGPVTGITVTVYSSTTTGIITVAVDGN